MLIIKKNGRTELDLNINRLSTGNTYLFHFY